MNPFGNIPKTYCVCKILW